MQQRPAWRPCLCQLLQTRTLCVPHFTVPVALNPPRSSVSSSGRLPDSRDGRLRLSEDDR